MNDDELPTRFLRFLLGPELNDQTEEAPDTQLSEINSLLPLFTMETDRSPLRADLNGLIRARNQELAGKTCFIIGKGLVGISTAPVKLGNSLALLHPAPIYLILRKVEGRNGDSSAAQKHRIVARAAVDNS
ncbi:hypothetical protein CHU98_g11390 [Xylaria longipes]|nr:hypothetical protein CHU98_g11390 [Xylaria longipes]